MDIFKTLQKLKEIRPEKDFTIKSRSLLFAKKHATGTTFWNIIVKNIELGTSVALAGLLIFMILGGFSAWKFFSPIEISNLDPSSLKAEARAIDIQIQLTNLNYKEVAAIPTKTSESTISAPTSKFVSQPPQPSSSSSQTLEKSMATPAASSSYISIDEALQELSN